MLNYRHIELTLPRASLVRLTSVVALHSLVAKALATVCCRKKCKTLLEEMMVQAFSQKFDQRSIIDKYELPVSTAAKANQYCSAT